MTDIKLIFSGTGLKDFLASLVAGLQYNIGLMKTFTEGEEKRSKWNGRKIVLQDALNDIFGITTAPYIIVECNQGISNNEYFYLSSELSPVYFKLSSEKDPTYFFKASELGTVDYDFIVKIPTGIYTTELERQVKAQTNLYKVAGTRFIIQTY